jgi:hypothetical protein
MNVINQNGSNDNIFDSVILPSAHSKMSEGSARMCPNTLSPKKTSKSVLEKKRPNTLHKKIKEIAHRKISMQVEMAALRNSLPRINVLKHAKLNKDLN